jgi:hypothetical protein
MHANSIISYSELRVETLNPPFMTMARPVITKAPSQILFNQAITLNIDIPKGLNTANMQGNVTFFI